MALLAADSSTVAELLTAYVAIATAAGTAIWAVMRYLADRRDARAQQDRQAADQLVQRQVEEERARQQRAAELVKAVGDATDDRARRWTMSALSLYPDEALDLLLNSLGEASAADATAIKIAVISVGPSALPHAVRAHRIAGQMCRTTETEGALYGAASDQRQIDTATAGRVRDCTREIILQLVFQLDEDQRAAVDLAYVDLTRVSLAGARLSRISLRKTRLDKAILVRAYLNGAVLRGATVDGTVLSGARLRSADLTGAVGGDPGDRRRPDRGHARSRQAGRVEPERRASGGLLPLGDPPGQVHALRGGAGRRHPDTCAAAPHRRPGTQGVQADRAADRLLARGPRARRGGERGVRRLRAGAPGRHWAPCGLRDVQRLQLRWRAPGPGGPVEGTAARLQPRRSRSLRRRPE